MAYAIGYQLRVYWVSPGIGPSSNATGPGLNGGPAQVLAFFNSETGGYPPNAPTFTATDVTNLLASMTTDLSTQMNAQLARVQAFSTGGG